MFGWNILFSDYFLLKLILSHNDETIHISDEL